MVMAVGIWDAAVVVIIMDGAEAADITMVGADNPRISQTKKRPPQLAAFQLRAAGQYRPLADSVERVPGSALVPPATR
jgi:hypothetical protein